MIESMKEVTPVAPLDKHVKIAVKILNQAKDVEMASPFWVSVMEVLENDMNRTQWLYMI